MTEQYRVAGAGWRGEADDVAARLAALEARVQVLEQRQGRVSRADGRRLCRILAAVAGAWGSRPFIVREVLAADEAGLRVATAGLNGRRLGRLLRRAVGQAWAGYTVRALGREGHATVWSVERVLGGAGVSDG